jgi:hypothetical protein
MAAWRKDKERPHRGNLPPLPESRWCSHGCVRILMDIASFFHKLVHTPGTPVYIRHG